MTKNVALLSHSELLEEEANMKKQLSELDAERVHMPKSTYLSKRKYLNDRLEKALLELEKKSASKFS